MHPIVQNPNNLKRKIQKFLLPLQINPNLILNMIKQESRANLSPSKIKNETISKICEESRKFQMLRIMGKELVNSTNGSSNSNSNSGNSYGYGGNVNHSRDNNSNNGKNNSNSHNNINNSNSVTNTSRRMQRNKVNANFTITETLKQSTTSKIKQILNKQITNMLNILNKDEQLVQYQQLFSKLKQLSIKNKQLKQAMKQQKQQQSSEGVKVMQSKSKYKCKNIVNQENEYVEQIVSNPILARKIIQTYQHEYIKKSQNYIEMRQKQQKRSSFSDEISNKRVINSKFKKSILNTQKQYAPHELKRLNNFIQYRQFLMLINLSNKIIVTPQPQIQRKAFICKGNNGLLVKSIVKSRPWWVMKQSADADNCSLVWSQWKKNKMTNNLPSTKNKEYLQENCIKNQQKRVKTAIINNKNQRIQVNKKNITEQAIKNYQTKLYQSIQGKIQQINKICKLQNMLPIQSINQQTDSSYFTFTRKINENKFEQMLKSCLTNKQQYLQYSKKTKQSLTLLNHLPGCLQLHSKKLLYLNMKKYYQKNGKQVFEYLPETHVIKEGINDKSFISFVNRWKQFDKEKNDPNVKNKTKNIWICKPGQNSNRGNGITVVSTLQQIKDQISKMNSASRSLIIQKYMQNPYLYNKRKFDIRCYILITSVNGILKGYFYNEGYIRTTSKQYNLKNLDNKFVHLTNDAIQKKGEEYGKFQNFNKVSFLQFEKYVELIDKQECVKFQNARKKIKEIATQIIYAVSSKLNPQHKNCCFQLFGLDFMLDAKMKPYLIQANSNPCLQVDGPVLSKIIPPLIQNVMRVAIDPLYPPPYEQNWKTSKFSPGSTFENNRFQIIYDSLYDQNSSCNDLKAEELKQLQEQQEECIKQVQNQIQ